MFKFSFLTVVHQNSTCGAAENIGTATKPNGIMHEPVRADRPNAFSNNSSSVLSCIQTTVDILSQTAGPSTFELPDHTLVGPGHEGGVRVVRPKILTLHNQPSFLTLETDRAAVENVFNLKGISSSADTGHLGNATVPCTGDGSTWNNIEGINSDKSIDIGRPSLALRSSSCRSVVQEPEVGSSYVDRNFEHNSSLVVCSSSGIEIQGGDSSTSTSANQQENIRDLDSEEEEQRKLRMEELRKAKRKNRDEFRKLMEENVVAGILNAKTNWCDNCIKIKDFAAYLAVLSNTSGSTAKDLFTDVMDELEK
ncbi:hypothetical protein T459_28805 [Capsicum annuum]|uniref:Uncharacterized protein n=1 Tax=Capsicum annuum TaxID=4072 RepID=A0A2G2YHT8_CAPAN|nr:hypothetical protein T459_28805 [Capsicum annuum]